MNIKLVEACKNICRDCEKIKTFRASYDGECDGTIIWGCIDDFLREQEKLINEQRAQAVKDAYRKGQQSIDTKSNLPDAG